MRYPLIDGQGNFGSIDGDSPAAMRYTEARLRKIGEDMAEDLYKETVDFVPNYDNVEMEPTVMPTRIPNLLINGSSGIAVGMATNIPTHNLSEVIDACVAYIEDPEIDTAGLMQYVKAPDFPTGCDIYGLSGVRDAYETGRGRVVMRAVCEIEPGDYHDKIIVTAIPYNVNKEELIKDIEANSDYKVDSSEKDIVGSKHNSILLHGKKGLFISDVTKTNDGFIVKEIDIKPMKESVKRTCNESYKDSKAYKKLAEYDYICEVDGNKVTIKWADDGAVYAEFTLTSPEEVFKDTDIDPYDDFGKSHGFDCWMIDDGNGLVDTNATTYDDAVVSAIDYFWHCY
jgi:DNA gyrase/topoisomerase IV subunit A